MTSGAFFTKPADGTGVEQQIEGMASRSTARSPNGWSPDGSLLVFTDFGLRTDVYVSRRGEPARLFAEDACAAALSPDGRFIAFMSPADETNVYVRPVEGEGQWQVSAGGGGYPRWSANGRELFYIALDAPKRALMVARVEPGQRFRVGAPQVVLEGTARYLTATAPASNWDVAPAGDRFVFVQAEGANPGRDRIEMALHWARHLANVPAPGGTP